MSDHPFPPRSVDVFPNQLRNVADGHRAEESKKQDKTTYQNYRTRYIIHITTRITRVADGEHVIQVPFSSFYHYFDSNQNS